MKPVFNPTMDAALAAFNERLLEEVPEIAHLLNVPGMSLDEHMRALNDLVAEHPELNEKISAVATEAFKVLQEPEHPALVAGNGIVVPPAGEGLDRLDPLYEAHLLERIQFDGDAPELRFGAMPLGATPAVPVLTDARDPVAVGWMLQRASEEVAAEVRQIESRRAAEVQRLLGVDVGGESTTAVTEWVVEDGQLAQTDSYVLSQLERDSLPDPEGYERGKVPALRSVEPVPGWGLAALEPEQRQQLAWKTLSTTQGRRSMVMAVRDLIAGGLRNDGYDVVVAEGEPARVPPERVLAYAEWTVDMGGPHATQASFAFADVAWRSLLRKLEEAVPSPVPVVLEVAPVNTVDVRKVGFCARFLSRE